MTNLLGHALRIGPARLLAVAWPLRLVLLMGLGALAGLGQVPFSLPGATLLGLAAMFLLGLRAGFGAGWAFGAGYFALTLHWIVEPFLVEPERTGWMAPFALVATAGGFALFWGAAFGLARRLRLGALGLAALWGAAEAVRSLAFTGFPWALIGHAWSETPLAQLAALVGVHGLTLLTLLAAAALARGGLAGGAGVLAALAAGVVFLDPGPAPAPAPTPGAPLVRLVQPNVPQAEKWDPVLAPSHLARMLELSGGEEPAALVVWPETAPSELLDWAGPTLAAGAAAGGGLLATGIARQDDEGRYLNSLALADRTGAVLALYDKAHLVPFGEYMPFRGFLSRWGLRGVAEFQGQGFSPGAGPALIDVPGIGAVRPLICYEGIFAEEIGGERPRLLLLVTNDAWFGRFAGPRQHLALGRLRAIEQGLPLLRAANTGISAAIDGKGRVLGALPLNEAGALDVALPPALPATVYARTGDAPALLALALLALAAWRRRPRLAGLDRGAPRP